MTPARQIKVYAGNRHLAGALRDSLAGVNDTPVSILARLEDASPPGVVLTTAADCSAAACSRLVEAGLDVVVLVVLPSSLDESSYRRAGAAGYLPMGVDLGPLRTMLRALL